MIIKCYEDQYWFEDDIENADGIFNDHLVSHICTVLHPTAWPSLPNDDDSDEKIQRIQLNLMCTTNFELQRSLKTSVKKTYLICPWISFVTDRGISILRRPTNSTLAQSFDVMQGQERMV